jgi:hypothetical protein
MMRQLQLLLMPMAAALLAMTALRAGEALVVIVNPTCGITQLTKEEATDIFMGRQKRLPCGLLALPVEESTERARFYGQLVNLPLPQVRAYWARLYFSGQAQPPRRTHTPEETLEVVGSNKSAIGFVEASKVDQRVRAVLQLDPK